MGEERSLFIFMTLLVFLYNVLILVRMLLLIPALNNFFYSKSLGTESKAFLNQQNMHSQLKSSSVNASQHKLFSLDVLATYGWLRL